jgi:hypothetical protein
MTPAEARVRNLLGELASGGPPDGDELSRSVVRTARWQRPVRRTLLALGGAAGAVAAGAGSAFRAYKRR